MRQRIAQSRTSGGLLRPETETLYLVGDTMQLPATVSRDGEQMGHGRSIMERLCDLGVHATKLTVQRRMHPEIVAYPNERFYGGELTTDYTPSTDLSEFTPLRIVNVSGAETAVGTSFQNEAEVQAIEDAFEGFSSSGVELGQMVIITPYAATAAPATCAQVGRASRNRRFVPGQGE